MRRNNKIIGKSKHTIWVSLDLHPCFYYEVEKCFQMKDLLNFLQSMSIGHIQWYTFHLFAW